MQNNHPTTDKQSCRKIAIQNYDISTIPQHSTHPMNLSSTAALQYLKQHCIIVDANANSTM